LGFPVSIDGSIIIDSSIYPEITAAVVAPRLRAMLVEAKASHVEIVGDDVQFRNYFLWPVWNWNILVPYEAGRFTVARGADGLEVQYELNTRRLLKVVTAIVGLMGAFFLVGVVASTLSDDPNAQDMAGSLPVLAVLLLGFWLWLFGMNYLIARFRVRPWLRSGLIY